MSVKDRYKLWVMSVIVVVAPALWRPRSEEVREHRLDTSQRAEHFSVALGRPLVAVTIPMSDDWFGRAISGFLNWFWGLIPHMPQWKSISITVTENIPWMIPISMNEDGEIIVQQNGTISGLPVETHDFRMCCRCGAMSPDFEDDES